MHAKLMKPRSTYTKVNDIVDFERRDDYNTNNRFRFCYHRSIRLAHTHIFISSNTWEFDFFAFYVTCDDISVIYTERQKKRYKM